MTTDRHDRQVRFFMKEGQERLRATKVAVVGTGGLGSHAVQQLAFLGVGNIIVVDEDVPDITNLNRLIGTHHDDHLSGITKVGIMARMVREIDPTINIATIDQNLISTQAFDAVKDADFVFGCVDNDGPRIVLTELCSAYRRPYLDLATEILTGPKLYYGGRVCFSNAGEGCLDCLDQISPDEVRDYFMSKEEKDDKRKLYGLPLEELQDSGPSVVTLNGAVASLATTEFMVHVTGIRQARRLVTYRAHDSKVLVGLDEPKVDCYYCKSIYGTGPEAGIERYLSRVGVSERGSVSTDKRGAI